MKIVEEKEQRMINGGFTYTVSCDHSWCNWSYSEWYITPILGYATAKATALAQKRAHMINCAAAAAGF